MNNSYENLPEEYENDGNTYCHGIVNCKYYNEGECIFYDMGSGNPDDMPCISQANSTIKAFQEWREKKEIEQTKVLEERPQGEWYYNIQNGWHCSICHETVKDMPTVMGKATFNYCPNCGADMQKGGAE